MSTLWTPDGERPVRRDPPAAAQPAAGTTPPGQAPDEPSEAEVQAQMAELQAQLARTPAERVVANHAFGLFELAALHLSLEPPQLDQARLAIDALGALVEGMAGRLGEAEPQLGDGLAQLRLAFVQIRSATEAAEGAPPAP
ncbi:MAG: hypothetical protein ACYC1D_06390 [Acidimicrobiales bacterium]